jgi:ribulose-phosphate 3-epimerase
MFDPYGNPLKHERVEIIPAILEKSFAAIEKKAALVKGAAKRVQIDVVDGVFAKTSGLFSRRTWPYQDHGTFLRVVKEEHGLPYWGDINYEFDLMINDPAEKVMDYVHAGASHIVVHAGAKDAVLAVQKLVDLREESGAFEVKAGVALTCDAQPEELEKFEAQFDYVQVMGIATIGRQGGGFDDRALHLLERLHARYPQLHLQVDGGVNAGTIPKIVKAGASSLVMGSAIFGAKDAGEAIKSLDALANGRME